jgi:hypothetical protein
MPARFSTTRWSHVAAAADPCDGEARAKSVAGVMVRSRRTSQVSGEGIGWYARGSPGRSRSGNL